MIGHIGIHAIQSGERLPISLEPFCGLKADDGRVMLGEKEDGEYKARLNPNDL